MFVWAGIGREDRPLLGIISMVVNIGVMAGVTSATSRQELD